MSNIPETVNNLKVETLSAKDTSTVVQNEYSTTQLVPNKRLQKKNTQQTEPGYGGDDEVLRDLWQQHQTEKTPPPLEFDLQQTKQQLITLGYSEDETIYLRAFYSSDNPKKADDYGRKGEATLNYLADLNSQIEDFQLNGRGVYFVVNGHGSKDSDIKDCRAIFYEHDDLPKEQQITLWKNLNLPEPTIQIDTGSKSIHSYWAFTEPIQPVDWKALQTDLLNYSDGDKSLKNPARVMRLAGCYHISSKGCFRSEIISNSGKKYTYQDLRDLIPQTTSHKATSKSNKQPKSDRTKANEKSVNRFTGNSCGAITLEKCLFKKHRDLLEFGVQLGERNKVAVELAANLIGTATRLQFLGIEYEGNPRALYDNFCAKCTPPIEGSEGDSCWTWAEQKNPIAGLPDDMLLNCAKAWNRNASRSQLVEIKNTAKTDDNAEFYETYKPDSDTGTEVFQVETTSDETVLVTCFQDGLGDWTALNDAYFRYSGMGHWVHQKDGSVKKVIAQHLRKFYTLIKKGEKVFKFATDANKKSAFNYCRSALQDTSSTFSEHLLCFKNGTVDIRTGDLHQHNKNDLLTTFIDADYIPNAECPKVFQDFIESSFGLEFLPLIRAAISMYIDPTALYGYFLHIVGSSGSGKGTFIRFLTSLFGHGSVTSLGNLSQIDEPDGRHQYLTGVKLLSIPDTGGFQKSLSSFYELVDNGSLAGRALYSSDGYEKQWNCRFIVASVDLLSIENSGAGWARRCIPIPTKLRANPEHTDINLDLHECRSEVISWALALKRDERDRIIKQATRENQKIKELVQEQSIFGDSVKAYIDMCLRPTADDSNLTISDLHDNYVAFCKAHGFKPNQFNKFSGHLKNIVPMNYVKRKQFQQEGILKSVPQHFKNLKNLPGIFNNSAEVVCVKAGCQAGGLDEIALFWTTDNKKDTQKSHSTDSRVTLGSNFTLECSENHTQQAIQPPTLGTLDSSIKVKESELKNIEIIDFVQISSFVVVDTVPVVDKEEKNVCNIKSTPREPRVPRVGAENPYPVDTSDHSRVKIEPRVTLECLECPGEDEPCKPFTVNLDDLFPPAYKYVEPEQGDIIHLEKGVGHGFKLQDGIVVAVTKCDFEGVTFLIKWEDWGTSEPSTLTPKDLIQLKAVITKP
ncbi:MAG: hypothetical protein HC785_16560 [Calothrix sp. CSU_2_0]|nr:hypothetical protein [Calothrix sp. CSU_2_0]